MSGGQQTVTFLPGELQEKDSRTNRETSAVRESCGPGWRIKIREDKGVIPPPEGLITVIECVGTPLWGDTARLFRWKTKMKSEKLNEVKPWEGAGRG